MSYMFSLRKQAFPPSNSNTFFVLSFSLREKYETVQSEKCKATEEIYYGLIPVSFEKRCPVVLLQIKGVRSQSFDL